MRKIGIDIETYSSHDIGLGVYKYSEAPDFQVLLFAYKIDDEPTKLIDCTTEDIPQDIIEALQDTTVIKTAFNAQFERVCLNKWLNIESVNWHCTMIKAWNLGIYGGLARVSKAIGIDEDSGKMKEGKNLIRKFSVPRKPTKNNLSTRNYPEDLPEDWEKFKEYCIRDVDVEDWIQQKLSRFELPEEEQKLYELDQKINDRGVRIDLDMVDSAISIIEDQTYKYTQRFSEITGIDSPNKLGLLKEWLGKRSGETIDAITKESKEYLLDLFKDDKEALTALDCRFNTGKASVAKYDKMKAVTCADGRSRGNIQFYGASRTGRFAGRLIQVHNLPQNHVADINSARRYVKYGNFELLEMMYDDPADILKQCIRPCIIPDKGSTFAVADFSAIEARVIAWLAGEDWVVDVFKSHGKIYEATAARMLNVPFESIKKGSPERQKGKVATLALGYQGSVGALKAMGALKMGIAEEELQPIVDLWRKSNSKIVNLWYNIQNAASDVIREGGTISIGKGVTFHVESGFLRIKLPSGRYLSYPKPSIRAHQRFENATEITFKEVTHTGANPWKTSGTYGGKLTENIVQAIARDCLAYSMIALDKAGFDIVMHVHDEVVAEVSEKDSDSEMERMTEIMGSPIPWAEGLPLRADGYTCDFYIKD